MHPIDERNLRQYLGAFADGELAPDVQLAVIRYLEAHPNALKELAQIQRVRSAAEQAVVRQTPAVPEELQQRITGIVAPALGKRSRRVAWPAIAAIVALACVVGFVAGEYISRPAPDTTARVDRPSPPPAAASNGIATVAVNMTHVHVDCSRFPLEHTAQIPRELGSLSDALLRDLQSGQPFPDLTKMGYRYVGAGPCAAPLANTVHLLYVSTKPGAAETLSIFVQPASAQPQFEVGKLYAVASRDAAHPAIAWKTAQVVYFLVGDANSTVDQARSLIAERKKLTRRADPSGGARILHIPADDRLALLFAKVSE
jgi:hypothetical protein